jgi:hypothetical protein
MARICGGTVGIEPIFKATTLVTAHDAVASVAEAAVTLRVPEARSRRRRVGKMAAVAKSVETNAENRLERALSNQIPMARTDVHGRANQTSFLEPAPAGQTWAVTEGSPTTIISDAAAVPAHAATTPVVATGIRKIEGVVSEIMKDSVIIECIRPTGNLDLRLPSGLVPTELMSFGTPVWISLETTGGIRMPVVKRRSIERQPKIDGQDAVEDWLNSA